MPCCALLPPPGSHEERNMWLMTPIGFFSIVCKPDDVASGTLTIRARVKSDLEALRRDFLPRMTAIVEGGGTDYPYRAKAPRGEVAEAIAQVTRRIDYGNFKDEVAARQGRRRAAKYGRVWSVLYDLEERRDRSAKPQS
jgi:hypothetical protein